MGRILGRQSRSAFGPGGDTDRRQKHPRPMGRAKAEGLVSGRGVNHCRFLIGELCDRSGFQKRSLSSGRMGAKTIVLVYYNEGLAVDRGRQSHRTIYSAPKGILCKQCAMRCLRKSVFLKYVYFNNTVRNFQFSF